MSTFQESKYVAGLTSIISLQSLNATQSYVIFWWIYNWPLMILYRNIKMCCLPS